MSFKNNILKWGTWLSAKRFEKSCKKIQTSFENTWGEMRSRFLKGDFWTTKGMNETSSLNDFDITGYSFYESAMNDSVDSGLSAFTSEKVIFSPMTSGTNGSMKPFIITTTFKNEYQSVTGPTIHYLTKKFDIGSGKFIYLISLSSMGNYDKNVPTGTIGNFTYKTLPNYLKSFYAIPFEIFTSPENFQKLASHFAIAADVTALFSVTPPIFINFLNQVLEDVDRKILQVLDKSFQRKHGIRLTAKRRKILESLVNESHEISAIDLWPNLKTMTTWTSSVCKLSLPELRNKLGDKIKIIDGIYSATEGWVTVQNDPCQKGCSFYPQGTLLEFVDVDLPMIKENILKPWEIEVGKEYEVLFTNSMGLIRYQIGDVIKCNDFFYGSPVIEFSRKISSCLSLGILRLNEDEFFKSCEEFRKEFPFLKFFFSNSQSGFSLGIYISCDKNADYEKIVRLAKRIDLHLKSLSGDYEKERDNNTVSEIEVNFLKSEFDYFIKDTTGQMKPKLIVQENVDAKRIIKTFN